MLIDKVKVALRIAVNDYDAEIQGHIDAAFKDLGIVNIREELLTEEDIDPLIEQAVITYCRVNFDYRMPADQYQRLKSSYDEQKAQLLMNSSYTDWGESDA